MSRYNVFVCLFTVALLSCNPDASSDQPAPPQHPSAQSELRLHDGQLRDRWGRTVVMRGVNARVEGIFDVTFDDGRTALQPIPEFDESDFEKMRSLGFNVLRLPINWSGVEPTRGEYDEAYLRRVDEMVEWCAEYRIYCLIDFHQDAYSKHIGEDGAPLWAIVPEPDELLEGPLGEGELEERRASRRVLEAFDSFWANEQGIRDAFVDMFTHVAERYSDESAVVGIEVFNEPVVRGPIEELWSFYSDIIDSTRAAGVEKPLFMEPNAFRNILDKTPPPPEPFPDDQIVYAPHIYTTVFSSPFDHFESGEFEDLEPSMTAAREEADAFATPRAGLFVGEYGIKPSAENARLFIEYQLDLQEQTLSVGSAYWVWEELSQGNWGLLDGDDGPVRDDRIEALSRPYPMYVAGELRSVNWSRDEGELTFVYSPQTPTGDPVNAPNVVFASPEYYWALDSVTVECNGQALSADAVTQDATYGTISFNCPGAGGETVEVRLFESQ